MIYVLFGRLYHLLYSVLLYSLYFIKLMGIRRVCRALRPVWTDDRILVLRFSSPGSVVGELGRRSVGQDIRAEAGGHAARRDQTWYYFVLMPSTTENRLLGIQCFAASLWLKFIILKCLYIDLCN